LYEYGAAIGSLGAFEFDDQTLGEAPLLPSTNLWPESKRRYQHRGHKPGENRQTGQQRTRFGDIHDTNSQVDFEGKFTAIFIQAGSSDKTNPGRQ
jgi:hypothetical protein